MNNRTDSTSNIPVSVTPKKRRRADAVSSRTMRSDLRGRLRDFVRDASLADVMMMREVVMDWDAISGSDTAALLACAFENTITGNKWGYVRLPDDHADAVIRYIDDLREGKTVEVKRKWDEPPTRLQLPETMRTTQDERIWIVRLIRLLRENYWLAELIRQILKAEAERPQRTNIKHVRALLDNFDTIEALASNARRLGNNWSDHPVLKAIRNEWKEIEDYKDERSIDRLIESAHQKSK